MRPKSETPNFKLLVTYIIIRKQANESVLPIHPIGYDRSRHNKSLRDEELRKAEHLSTTNDLRAHFGQYISTKKYIFVRSTASLNVYWQTVYVNTKSIRYAIDFSSAVRESASLNELLNFPEAQVTYGYVLDRASYRQSNKLLSS